jgi:hypothetical protein
MNIERAILLILLAAKGDALEAAAIRRELPAFTQASHTLADVIHAIETLEEKREVIGTAGPREDDGGKPVAVFTLTTKGRLRALKQ